MIVYVLIGGMKGTTWVQIIKAVLLIAGAAVMTIWVLAHVRLQPVRAARARRSATPTTAGEKLLSPGLQYGKTATTRIDFISLGLALVLGTAGLPHVLMRFYTVPTAKEARRSVVWAIWLIGIFYLFTLVLGYGAGALVGPDAIKAAPGGANSAAPLLAFELGGDDPAGHHLRRGLRDDPRGRGRPDDHGVGIVRPRHLRQRHQAGQGQRRRRGQGRPDRRPSSSASSRSSAASSPTARTSPSSWRSRSRSRRRANLPTILYSLFWRRFNTRGALWSIYGGLVIAIDPDHLLARWCPASRSTR